jgi:cytochrome c553
MKRTLIGNVSMAAWVGFFLAVLAATPALAQWMGGGRWPMGNGAMQSLPPAMLPDPGSLGARLLVSRCTQCHGLVSPGQYSARQWPGIVEAMNRRMWMRGGRGMGMMGGLRPLGPGEEATLIAYLQAHAFSPAPSSSRPPTDRREVRAFAETCSRCHALPAPSAHRASEWPAVVGRMERYLRERGENLTASQKRTILNYLKENARKE